MYVLHYVALHTEELEAAAAAASEFAVPLLLQRGAAFLNRLAHSLGSISLFEVTTLVLLRWLDVLRGQNYSLNLCLLVQGWCSSITHLPDDLKLYFHLIAVLLIPILMKGTF